MNGLVSLVGAGPGDPELLTVKAARRLDQAEVVFHDALVSPEVLALAHRAWRVPVGKRAGKKEVSQDDIHRLLVRTARRGRRVVRLKGGDPFVLGRGGEEALALAEAGVPFEVVPGVSSALAAPALANVPVTHRGLASGFVVVSGHAETAWRPLLDALPPSSVTVVVLMGVAARARIATALLARGWPAATPAAALFGASTPEAQGWFGDLAALAREPATPGTGAPGCLCIGPVVGVAATLARLKGRARDEAGSSAR
jgi:uroporphyrin-III C-methyltransferase/precorrin-2 dehydrogenase/sirohydrochlorin ferrochelatase